MQTTPVDVQPYWLQIARRAQSVLKDNNGYGILRMVVLVGPDQKPRIWLEPTFTKIEPRNGTGDILADIIDCLSADL